MAKTIMAKGGRELWGRLDEESIFELIGPICQSGSSLALIFRLGSELGHFYFKGGRLVHADTKSIRSKEAAYELISWRDGVFRLIKDREPEVETVDISWSDFKEHYLEELEKIALGLVPKVEGGFYLELQNVHDQPLFFFDPSERGTGLSEKDRALALIKDDEIGNALAEMRKGNIDDYRKVIYDSGGGSHILIVRILRELRHHIFGIFPVTADVEYYTAWLGERFEWLALDAVGLALAHSNKTGVRGTILVIDDSLTVREMLCDILTQNGFNAFAAEDGYEGLIKVHDVRPDLIILDVLMPRIDGYEVCRRLKRDDHTCNIPIVMLSQKELGEDAGTGFKEGADLYIEKPFTEKKIITIVENVLGLD